MTRSHSPLRYPGGKSSLYNLTREIINLNGLSRHEYAEPFAGGCGLALALLYGGVVSEIHINDLDPTIWSFWDAVLNNTDQLVDLIEKTPVNIAEWERQKIIMENGSGLKLGFAGFFLNRTNRSGIIKKAGAIGGINQDGKYLIDCRYNKPELIRRIRRVALYKERIHLTNLDAIEFLKNRSGAIPKSAFFCIDPPYYKKGKGLYTSFYRPEDHLILSKIVRKLKNSWMVTYDNVTQISDIYRGEQQFTFDISYSLNVKRTGTELLIAPNRLKIPSIWEEKSLCKQIVEMQ